MMLLKLTFHGPNTTVDGAPLTMGAASVRHTAVLVTPFLNGEPNLVDAKRIWDLERAFNELTTGRVHVELVADGE